MNAQVEDLSCQELVELVTDYVEGVLGPVERASFEHHIATCTGCHDYLAQMRAAIELTGRLTPADISPEAEAKLLAAFRNWNSG
ncbi:MAG TPA: zf-HC2 domain-containing protein [Gaiellaceae bacterium]|nr:zf-HC2 domain-containing protein [Gaiellaceae bacterium]